MRRTWSLVAAVLVSATLAGCADSPDNGLGPAGTSTTMTSHNAALETPASIPPVTQVLFFAPDGSLTPAEPANGSIAISSSMQSAFLGPEWNVLVFDAASFGVPAIIEPTTIEAEVWFEATGAYANPGFNDYVLWGPASSGITAAAIQNAPGAVVPGEPFAVTFSMEMEHQAPVFLPPGSTIQFQLATFNSQGETGSLRLLTGPATPSRVTVTWQALTEDPTAGGLLPGEPFTGHHDSGTFPHGAGTSRTTHEVQVDPNATAIHLRSQATSTGTRGDLDMHLRDGSTELMRSAAATSTEDLWLAGPAIVPYRGKTLTLEVVSFVGTSVDYEIQVETARHG